MSWNFQEKKIQDFPGGVGTLVENGTLVGQFWPHVILDAFSDLDGFNSN